MHGNPQQGGFSKKGVPLAFLFLFEECHGVGIRAATRAFHGMEVVREERGSMLVANIELILFWRRIDITAMTGGDESPGILRASLTGSCYHGVHLAPQITVGRLSHHLKPPQGVTIGLEMERRGTELGGGGNSPSNLAIAVPA